MAQYNKIDWLVDYVEVEQMGGDSIEALCKIAIGLNCSTKIEFDILTFADKIEAEVDRQTADGKEA